MYIMGTLNYPLAHTELSGTLWHCGICDSFVSIHRAIPVKQPMCPTCAEGLLDFCEAFDSILGKGFALEKSN
jgi:hypothetical protein